MRSLNKKILFVIAAILMAVMACNFQITATNPPPITTGLPPASDTETITPTSPSLSLVPLSSPELIDIDFQDSNNGWGIGQNAIVRTVDGGATWLNATPSGATIIGYLAQLFALDTDHVWVLIPGADYFSGTLFRTGDGGVNWTSYTVPFGGGSLQFLDVNTGRLLADRGAGAGSQAVELYQSSDGGATWNSVFHNDPSQPGSSDSLPLGGIKNGMTFLDANTGWVTGSRPMDGDVYLFVTHDGGVSWTQQSITLPPGYEFYQYIAQPPVFYGQDGLLPIQIYMTGVTFLTVYTTHDGGATWSGDPSDANKTVNTGVTSFPDPVHGWCWDGGPTLLATADGAQSWIGNGTSLDLTGRLSQIDFVSDGTGWALTNPDAGGHSQLYTTMDSSTWSALIP